MQLSYAIGVPYPISIYVDTFGTGTIDDEKLEDLVRRKFNLSPAGIIHSLDLLRPIYQQNVNYGHFGKPPCPGNKSSTYNQVWLMHSQCIEISLNLPKRQSREVDYFSGRLTKERLSF